MPSPHPPSDLSRAASREVPRSGTKAGASWWMYLIAATYLGYCALLAYSQLRGPAPPGLWMEFRGAMNIVKVFPNTPADRAGLQPGDRVVAIDGQPIRNQLDFEAIQANLEIGHAYQLDVERAGTQLQLTLTLPRAKVLPPLAVLSALRLALLCLGFFIAFSRPRDSLARLGGWFLATVAVSSPSPIPGSAAAWRALPAVLGAFLWIPALSVLIVGPILFTFFATFPRPFFRSRWAWLLVWLPGLALLPWLLNFSLRMVYFPRRTTSFPDWLLPASGVSLIAYILVGLVILLLNYRRLEDVNERRRVRVVVAGMVVTWLAAIPQILFAFWEYISQSQIVWVMVSLPVRLLSGLLFLAFPVSFAYAILRHRMFDIRVMIRQGVQYALARHLVFALVPAFAALLVLDLLLHAHQPLIDILRARGWVYLLLGGLALAAHLQRRRWLETLDRRFFRERYDAQHLLREVVEELRQAGGFDQVAPRVVAQIEAALHPEFVALLVRQPQEPSYRPLAAAPAGQAPPALPADSKLVALVKVLGKPLEVPQTESGWLQQQLPHEETDFLRRARIDLLVPIATAPERTEALLAVGPKRSEEPYTREDQDLLVAIASSLALLLEKPAVAPARLSTAFEECPRCGTCYDTGSGNCAQEGAALSLVALPRLLTGRYRLQQRLGRGGMGTVYAATDTALERRVAVKVIREDLVGSADAAERFRREAKAAASFTHPNVVTVHDFGVAAETRAFLVMELLRGLTLREELQQQKRLTPARALTILRSVAAGVEAAHRRQLIHRDLKPENVFLTRDEAGETPKVLDFGIAKFLPAATEATADTGTGTLVGTLYYMGPEQLRGGAVEPAWDLWALAVMAYEMLTGARPFVGSTPAEWHSAVLAGRSIPVATPLPNAPPPWQDFFARALALDRAQRPDSARAFLSELEAALA